MVDALRLMGRYGGLSMKSFKFCHLVFTMGLTVLAGQSYADEAAFARTQQDVNEPMNLTVECEFQVINIQPYQSVLVCTPKHHKKLNPIAAEPRLTDLKKEKS